MNALPALCRPRIAQCLRLLGSPHNGEVVAAARAVERTLRAAGLTLSELADEIEREPAVRVVFRDRPEPQPHVHQSWGSSGRSIVKMKLERALQGSALTAWEREFATSLVGQIAASWTWRPSPKQEQRLDALMAKLSAAGAWA